MTIVGSVISTPTVSSLVETAETVTFPQAGLTIVKILTNASYVKIPIDASRNAVFPVAGGNPTNSTPEAQISGTGRNVSLPINGTVLSYSVYALTTTPTTAFYYGSALQNAKPLSAYAGVTATATLSGGSGTATWTFPSGGLKLVGITGTMGLAAASQVLQLAFATSPGQTFTAFVLAGLVTQSKDSDDILPMSLPISQTVAVTLSGGIGSDKVVIYAYYQ